MWPNEQRLNTFLNTIIIYEGECVRSKDTYIISMYDGECLKYKDLFPEIQRTKLAVKEHLLLILSIFYISTISGLFSDKSR